MQSPYAWSSSTKDNQSDMTLSRTYRFLKLFFIFLLLAHSTPGCFQTFRGNQRRALACFPSSFALMLYACSLIDWFFKFYIFIYVSPQVHIYVNILLWKVFIFFLNSLAFNSMRHWRNFWIWNFLIISGFFLTSI